MISFVCHRHLYSSCYGWRYLRLLQSFSVWCCISQRWLIPEVTKSKQKCIGGKGGSLQPRLWWFLSDQSPAKCVLQLCTQLNSWVGHVELAVIWQEEKRNMNWFSSVRVNRHPPVCWGFGCGLSERALGYRRVGRTSRKVLLDSRVVLCLSSVTEEKENWFLQSKM